MAEDRFSHLPDFYNGMVIELGPEAWEWFVKFVGADSLGVTDEDMDCWD